MAKTLINMSDSRNEQFGGRKSGMASNPRLSVCYQAVMADTFL